MGKRELLLIGGFVLVGALVYFVTAPEPAPGAQGFSIGKLMDGLRREVRGHQSSAEVKTSRTAALTAGVSEIRFETEGATLTINGEDRKDVAFDMVVWSNGYDETEARTYASETELRLTEVGRALVVSIKYPEPGQQRATLTVRVPKALAVRVQQSRGKLDIADVLGAELVDSRGQVTIRRVSGRLVVTHRGGTLTLESIGQLKLNARGSVVTLKEVRGDVTLQLQAGELRATALGGPVELESNGTRITFEDPAPATKLIRLSTVGGSLNVSGLASEMRVDSRDTRIEIAIDKPAPVEIYAEGDPPMTVTLPPSGVTLEAVAIEGRLTVPDGLIEVSATATEQRAAGSIAGGGPKITLRASHGDITIRSRKPDA
jgi:Toastrack DUF4097